MTECRYNGDCPVACSQVPDSCPVAGLIEEIYKLKAQNKEIDKRMVDYEHQKNRLLIKLKKIKEIVTEPCLPGEYCNTCSTGCTQKDILNIINKHIPEIVDNYNRL